MYYVSCVFISLCRSLFLPYVDVCVCALLRAVFLSVCISLGVSFVRPSVRSVLSSVFLYYARYVVRLFVR